MLLCPSGPAGLAADSSHDARPQHPPPGRAHRRLPPAPAAPAARAGALAPRQAREATPGGEGVDNSGIVSEITIG